MRLVLVALISLAATPAFANALTFMGELNGGFIQVELTEPVHDAVAGRFTYDTDGADVPLRPVSVEGNVWTLAEEAPCGQGTCIADQDGTVAEPPIAATWQVTYDPVSYVAQVVRTPAGKAKPQNFEMFVLAWRKFADQPTAFDLHDRSARLSYDETLPLDWKHAPYEMQLLDHDLASGEQFETNGVPWTYVTEPLSGLTFPRILTVDGVFEGLGPILNAHFFRLSLSALDCKAARYASYGMSENFLGQGGHTAGFEDEQVTLSYVSPTLASWSQSGSLYCNGAHPYNHLDNYTLDARTGEALDWRKVFSAIVPRPWFSPPDEVVDVETALADPDSYDWGPSLDLIQFARDNSPEDLFEGDAELAEICFSDQAVAEQLDFRVVENADIMFTLSGFPHVSSVCNADLFSASLTDLAPFLAATAKDYFPETAD